MFSRGWEVLPDLSVVNRLRVGQSRAGSCRAHVFTRVRGSAWRPPPSSDRVFASLRRDEAEMEYLKIAQDLEMYGVNYFTIRVCGSPCEFPGRRGRRSQGQTVKTSQHLSFLIYKMRIKIPSSLAYDFHWPSPVRAYLLKPESPNWGSMKRSAIPTVQCRISRRGFI